MAIDFSVLSSNAAGIWHAELGALLHNLGKLHPLRIAMYEKPRQKASEFYDYELIGGRVSHILSKDTDAKTRWGGAQPAGSANKDFRFKSTLQQRVNAIPAEFRSPSHIASTFGVELKLPEPFSDWTHTIGTLIDFQDHVWYQCPPGRNETWLQVLTGVADARLCHLLQTCHQQASGGEHRSVERELEETLTGSPVAEPGALLSQSPPWKKATVFGFESPVDQADYANGIATLEVCLAKGCAIERRDAIRDCLAYVMAPAVSDPSIPIHDIRITDVCFAAAAFFKAAVAGSLLQNHVSTKPNWRMLRIAVDGQAYLEQANLISDLAGRKRALDQLFDSIQVILETGTPVGNEVYRDTQGPVFLLPVLEAPGQDAELQAWLSDRVQDCFNLDTTAGQELAFSLQDTQAFALGPDAGYSFALGELIERPVPPLCAGSRATRLWQGGGLELCTVCGVRPMAKTSELRGRKICTICHEARGGRCAEWRGDEGANTIWIDELADGNGRVALLTARLRLDGWLRQDNYISRTLPLQLSPSRMKAPTFARMERVLATGRLFWRDAVAGMPVKPRSRRMLWCGPFVPDPSAPLARLWPNWNYLLDFGAGFKVSVVCDGFDDGRPRLVVVENPDRLEMQLRGQLDNGLEPWFAGRRATLLETTGYGSPDKQLGTFHIAECRTWGEAYYPRLTLLQEPGRLWLFCPAADALQCAHAVFELYRTQMAKVRNRLGLDIGLVYFPAGTPVRAAVDAARRMSRARFPALEWTLAGSPAPQAHGRWRLQFEDAPAWEGIPDDPLFTTFEVAGAGVLTAPGALQTGARVRVEPSHFDFIYLEQTAARFQVVYNPAAGDTHYQRMGGGTRPHPIEGLADFQRAWQLLQPLATSQIKALDDRLHVTPELWPNGRDSTFQWFAGAALREAEWPRRHVPNEEELQFLLSCATRGVLEDVIEIHLGIQKDRRRDGEPAASQPEEVAL